MKVPILFSLLTLVFVLVAAYFSRHGYRDLVELQSKLGRARERILLLEKQNEDLQRQASLLEEPSEDLLEKQVRDFLGWVKQSELVYVEKSAQRQKK